MPAPSTLYPVVLSAHPRYHPFVLIARAVERLTLLMILLLLALPGATVAHAQDEAPSPQASPSPTQADAVSITALPFGTGAVVRKGEWAGIRLVVTDSATRPRSVALRFHLRDDDGDTELAERRVILNPNRQEGVWLYVRLPWQVTPQSVFTVTAHELIEQGDVGNPVVGRQLGATRVQPNRVVEPDVDLYAVIGRRTLGLSQYENAAVQTGTNATAEISHEDIQVVAGLSPDDLPDYWEGLAQFSVIVWQEGQPANLGSDLRPAAIREWVRRGGHLVIVLPPVGGEWYAIENPIFDLLPEAAVERKEGVSLEPYRRLLVSPELLDTIELPTNATIHTFNIRPDTDPADATAVIDGVDGTVVARRIVGTGMVTVVGLDLGSRALARAALPRADQFWNRILGKRLETPSSKKVEELGKAAFAGRSFTMPHYIDQYFNLEIAKSTAAGIGVLLALIVFIAYWIVAGPGGFGLLKMRGLERHSWLWFAAAIVVFAAAAWIGANALRETKTSGQHLTFLDHVYGQPVQHTGTWTSVLLPSYATETLLLDDPDLADRRQDIAVWSDSNGQSVSMSFPDARSYVVDVRNPQKITVPSRATIKQFKLDWEGPKQWGTPLPVGEGWQPRLGPKRAVEGRLVHDLPAPLEDVIILVNRGQISPERAEAQGQSPLLWDVQYASLGAAWAPGEVIDLAAEFDAGGRDATDFLKNLLPPPSSDLTRIANTAPATMNAGNSLKDYMRIAMYSLLPPPRFGESFSGTNRPPLVRRRDAHVWDLGKWFTQPCVVILGQIPTGSSPTPLYFRQGDQWQRIPLEGRTIIRWIYLLEPNPPVFGYDRTIPKREAAAPTDEKAH